VDTHAATEQAAVAGLQGVVDWVLDDDWRWWLWLCCVPGVFGCIKLGGQCGVKLLSSN
jgi:hypothetical protein